MQDTFELRVDSFRWVLDSSLADAGVESLLGPQGFQFERTQVEPVKRANHRGVYRVLAGGLDLHVKHYRHSTREWFRCLFRGRRAVREFYISREVARRGVPTIEVIGVGERLARHGKPDCFLLTRTLPGAVSLLDFLDVDLFRLPPALRAKMMQQLAVAMGKLLARQHAVGVRHDDLHPGNMLVSFAQGEPQLYLIDLDCVHLTSPMPWPASRDNLIVIDRWFAMRFGRSDRRRAWHAYYEARPDLGVDERQAAREIARATQRSLVGQMRQFDRRCLGGNRHFTRLHSSEVAGYAVTDLETRSLTHLIHHADQPFDQHGGKVLKWSRSSQVIEMEFTVGGSSRSVIFKRLPSLSWMEPLLAWFRPTPTMRSYFLGHGLRLRGLPTPRPLAAWHQTQAGFSGDGYLLFEKVPNALSLRDYVDLVTTRPLDERNARLWGVMDELARLLRQMHDWQMSHRDLKAANILVSPAGWVMSVRGLRDVEPCRLAPRDRIWFVDLVGVSHRRSMPRLRRLRDLARLHLSFLDHLGLTRTDRLRFLRTYMMWGLRGKSGWKECWREIHRLANDKAERNRARGRVIG
ncbi:MAG: lipopolysaccharide kinase InaA family protein [Gemmataceae bacterium]